MLTKEITYTNFEDQKVTEVHHFNLTKAELIEMETEQAGGMENYIQRIIAEKNPADVMKIFKSFIRKAYGVRVDGRFLKSSDISDAFLSSEAYSELILELITDADEAARFMAALVPKGIEEAAAKIQAAADNVVEMPKPEPKVLTRAEVIDMDTDELKAGLATGRYVIGDDQPA